MAAAGGDPHLRWGRCQPGAPRASCSWTRCRSSASPGWKCCGSRSKTGRSRSAAPQGSLTFPANFMLVGAENPCPCGYWGDPEHACSCSPMVISRYQKRLSGPLLDRTLAPHASEVSTSTSRCRASRSRSSRRSHRQRAPRRTVGRDPGTRGSRTGAAVSPVRQRQGRPGRRPDDQRRHTCTCGCAAAQVQVWDRPRCATTARWTRPAATPKVLGAAMQRLRPGDEPERVGVSPALALACSAGASVIACVKLARTIADLAGSERIQPAHIAEAIHLRSAAQTRVTRALIQRQRETTNLMTRAGYRSDSFRS